MDVSRGALCDELQRLADELGHSPTIRELDARCEYSRSAYLEEFGSWNAALEAADLTPNQQFTIPEDALIEELQRLGDELDETPRAIDMRGQGAYSQQAYVNQFSSWNRALEAAGFEPRHSTTTIPTTDLLEELQDVAAALNRTPTHQEVRKHGTHAVSTYLSRFDSWKAALDAAGLPAPPQRKHIPREALLEDLRRVADVVDGMPTTEDINEHGAYAAGTYFRRFDSLAAAREEADSPRTQSQARVDATKLGLGN